MSKKQFYQQGDVLFKQIDEFPEGERKEKEGNVVYEGEGSGHFHSIGAGAIFSLFFVDNKLFVENQKNNIVIEHQEHNPIELPSGKWEIDRTNEYDWVKHFEDKENAIRKAMD